MFAMLNLVMLIPIYLFYIGKFLGPFCHHMTRSDFARLTETAGRHLEDLDYLFANDSAFAWRAERDFAAMKSAEGAADVKVLQEKTDVVDTTSGN